MPKFEILNKGRGSIIIERASIEDATMKMQKVFSENAKKWCNECVSQDGCKDNSKCVKK